MPRIQKKIENSHIEIVNKLGKKPVNSATIKKVIKKQENIETNKIKFEAENKVK